MPQLSVAKILRTVFPRIESRFKPRTQGVIQRANLCRTPTLGTHRYRCDPCGRTLKVYNSCGDRHCPLCHGGQRNRWIERNASRLVPNTAYLQIVFTLPDKLSNLILANRGVLYRLLMKTVWDEVKRILLQLGIEPSAMLVLHTWNQRLKHHPHVHVLIPMAGISLDGTSWVSIENDPQFKAGTNWNLSKRFRKTFCRRMNLLNQRGQLKLPGNLAFLNPTQSHYSKDYVSPMQQWLEPIAPHGFRVFVQPPPQFDVKPMNDSLLPSPLAGEGLGMRGLSSDESVSASSSPSDRPDLNGETSSPSTTPQRIAMPTDRLLKYMARYLGGGPMADHRLKSWQNGFITFLARSREDEEADEQLWLFAEDQLTQQPTATTAQLSTKNQEPSTKNSAATGINLPLSVTKAKVEYTISEEEFVKRWASHILPPGFIRVQHYGATSRRRCKEYLAQCRKLLGIEEPQADNADADADVDANANADADADGSGNGFSDGSVDGNGNGSSDGSAGGKSEDKSNTKTKSEGSVPSADELEAVLKLMYGEEPAEKPYEPTWKCTKCGKSMQCLEFQLRPSWRLIFERLNHQADKDTQQWLWSLSELHALQGGANPNGSQSTAATSILAEAATQNSATQNSATQNSATQNSATQKEATQKSKSSSLKALTNPAILDSS